MVGSVDAQELIKRLRGAQSVFALTGAGISAESALPTFRGVGGLWRSHRVEERASPEGFARDPRRAGSRTLYELHGNSSAARCTNCDARRPLDASGHERLPAVSARVDVALRGTAAKVLPKLVEMLDQ